ncbi:hypothetical protein Asp14428_41920 [Actinoplanes sp. NBRC 14428]|nr:hypothetical protein Asp14428_41920 [Actinoplanes sp. NBRC 14428]
MDTWLVHGVLSGGVFGANAAAGAWVAMRAPAEAVSAAVATARRRRRDRDGCSVTLVLLARSVLEGTGDR